MKELFDLNNSQSTSSRKLNHLPPNPEKDSRGRFPSWLHRTVPAGRELWKTTETLRRHGMNTVCEEAKCPNRLECYSKKTATFLALGKVCTRACGFCEIGHSPTPTCDPEEAQKIALSVQELSLKHVVITQVARDDLEDGGASMLKNIVYAIHDRCPQCTIELLTSDFEGRLSSVDTVLSAKIDVFNHNVETVRRLTPSVRHKATYERSLTVLRHARRSGLVTKVKSGLMLGLGETKEEVQQTLHDLKDAGVTIVTIGQYLQASRLKLTVKSFILPDEFAFYETYGKSIGIQEMFCGPFVRSSYHAGEFVHPASP